MPKKALRKSAVLILASLMAVAVRAAEKPLDADDVTLLLLGGASIDRMVTLIEQRGVSFRMTPDLAKKFHDAGADDVVIEALQRAGAKALGSQPTAAPPGGSPTQKSSAPEATSTAAPAMTSAATPTDNEHTLAPRSRWRHFLAKR